jgi:hypothetical protein
VMGRSYYALVASLPGLPPHFDVERPPISRPRLFERLKMLEPRDQRVVDQWLSYTNWDRQVIDRRDEEVVQTYQALLPSITNAALRELITLRMDTRTIIAALRHRRAGMPPPIGVGQWLEHIQRNYQHPEFQLQGHFDWIGKLDQLLGAGDALAAQRLLFDTSYRTWTRMSEKYNFSFEAVLFYLARWEIIDRWTSCDENAGKERFETMITETLGEYAHLFK